jgi:Arf-GAP/SH3 domain/ANK repeat/PH domain-containing protein
VKTEWVSINLGIILCIECSGIHRSLGTHISKVRSLTLDITSFTADIVELLLAIGNRVSNMVWEAKLEPGIKPSPQATREQRLKFITAKYVDRAFVAPISATLSAYGTPDDTLLAAVKKNQIQQVLYALALRASPNVLDKSRATHPVFLALAAADPALPGTTLTPPTTSVATMAPPPPPRPGTPVQKPVAFPIAELLTQNGAEVPQTLPAFPLSRSALAWVEGKRSKRDSISPLPAGGLSAGGSINSGVAGGLGGGIAMSEKEREKQREARLQKRVSAGGRLAKAVIPER